MPSRKRAQGRARKARAQAAAPPGGARAEVRAHGCVCATTAHSQRIQIFANEFESFAHPMRQAHGGSGADVCQFMTGINKKCPHVFQAGENRTLAHTWLVYTATENILKDNDNYWLEARIAVQIVSLLERLEGRAVDEDLILFADHDWFVKHQDLLLGCRRSLVKFHRRRAPCSCLDGMYAQLKPQPTIGVCCGCGQRAEWRTPSDCSQCKCAQYCSKTCQEADWPHHKEWCKRVRRLTKKHGGPPASTSSTAVETTPTLRHQWETCACVVEGGATF